MAFVSSRRRGCNSGAAIVSVLVGAKVLSSAADTVPVLEFFLDQCLAAGVAKKLSSWLRLPIAR